MTNKAKKNVSLQHESKEIKPQCQKIHMKKTLLFIGLLVSVAVLAACQKDRECVCKTEGGAQINIPLKDLHDLNIKSCHNLVFLSERDDSGFYALKCE